MNLSKFQEMVIRLKIKPDQTIENAIFMYGGFKSRFNDEYEDIRADIILNLDENDQADLMASENIYQHAQNHNLACQKAVNKHIQYTLNIIDELQRKESEEVEEQCCIELSKHERATNED